MEKGGKFKKQYKKIYNVLVTGLKNPKSLNYFVYFFMDLLIGISKLFSSF